MQTLRKGATGVAVGASGAAVLTLQWWAFAVVFPAVLLALAMDGD